MEKKLCFSCAGKQHRALDCGSKRTCLTCNKEHHSSMCTKLYPSVPTIPSTDQGDVTHPVVVLLVDGIKCRALLDIGAESSHVSVGFMSVLIKKTIRKETKHIERVMNSTTKNTEVFKVQIKNIHGEVSFEAELYKVERKKLLKLPIPHYADSIKRYHHLRGITMDDHDQKEELPVHIILGVSNYSRIKTMTKPKILQPGEPVAEQTQLGRWKEMRLRTTRSIVKEVEQMEQSTGKDSFTTSV